MTTLLQDAISALELVTTDALSSAGQPELAALFTVLEQVGEKLAGEIRARQLRGEVATADASAQAALDAKFGKSP